MATAVKPKRLVEKVYRLTNGKSPMTCTLNIGSNHNLIVNDKNGMPQAIRHCINEKSIYVKLQSDYARIAPIVFKGGYLTVPANMQITQAFLDAHPKNVANGGHLFEFVDDEKQAKTNIEDTELKVVIKSAIIAEAKKKDGIHSLKQVASVIKGSLITVDGKGIEELKEMLYEEVDRNPKFFVDEAHNVDVFDDAYLKRKYLALRAIKAGVLKESSDRKSILWTNNNEVVFQAPVGQNLMDTFSDFLGTDDGLLVIETITARL